jgi:hypothetical protein
MPRMSSEPNLGVLHVRGVAVAAGQILGDDGGAVGRLPDETVEGDRRRHAAPHDRRLDPRRAQDLRHLRDMAEHVR